MAAGALFESVLLDLDQLMVPQPDAGTYSDVTRVRGVVVLNAPPSTHQRLRIYESTPGSLYSQLVDDADHSFPIDDGEALADVLALMGTGDLDRALAQGLVERSGADLIARLREDFHERVDRHAGDADQAATAGSDFATEALVAAEASPLSRRTLLELSTAASTTGLFVFGDVPLVVMLGGTVGLVAVRGLGNLGAALWEGARPEIVEFGGDLASTLLEIIRRRLGIERSRRPPSSRI